MKAIQVSKHIWSLNVWVGIPIRVWVIIEEEGVTIVDTGISIMARNIVKLVEQLKAGPLLRILLTHGHPDHVGALNRILKVMPAPVYAHRIEIPYMEGDQPYSSRKKAAPTIGKGVVQMLPANENGKLQTIGALAPYHTPGHSPGHVAYFHEQDQVLLAGDLFTSRKGKLHRPMPRFTAKMDEAIRSSSVVRDLKPIWVQVSHGQPVHQAAEHLDSYVAAFTSSTISHIL